ncbi:GNAT family N-acetyltransferase [Saccharothrix obliqua]|uniref:GNAT family N-acetyltransferase n=1 Tax=Saccharothrix obliqua TaxID=2861747 RepID=UPI001C5F0130|nr:GNAT family N-acetyltransferase [Saccharothrix obliqua]MBW4721627.1 GNAT family N-acetyltransferase [Saccharothrix obliqua]
MTGVVELATTTPGLALVELTAADAAAYYAVLDRNRDHLGRHGDYRDEVAATPEWVAEHLARPVPDRFGIRLRGRLVGRVDLVHVDPPRYGLGYWLDRAATGRGHATAACAAVIGHARAAGATDVFAGVTRGNDRSAAVLRRLGFRPVAELPTHTRFHLPLGADNVRG